MPKRTSSSSSSSLSSSSRPRSPTCTSLSKEELSVLLFLSADPQRTHRSFTPREAQQIVREMEASGHTTTKAQLVKDLRLALRNWEGDEGMQDDEDDRAYAPLYE